MYWKIDQRLPVDTHQGPSAFQSGPAMSSGGTAFASVFADRLNTAGDMAEPLSTAFVKWLALSAHPAPDRMPATTMDWMAGTTPASPPAATPAKPVAQAAPAPISSLIQQAASRYHLDPSLISSVIAQESSFDPHAVSVDGAQGLMQLMPDTARELNVTNSFDPAQNIDGGSRYLAGLIQRYHGDVKLALSAYNWGMGNLERQPDKVPAETRHYVASIMQRWQASGGDRLA
jgi:soluble lytic murein transglycosylase-like protein